MGMGCGISMIKYILFVFNLICAVSTLPTYTKPSFFLSIYWESGVLVLSNQMPSLRYRKRCKCEQAENCASIVFALVCEVWVRRVGPVEFTLVKCVLLQICYLKIIKICARHHYLGKIPIYGLGEAAYAPSCSCNGRFVYLFCVPFIFILWKWSLA